MWISAVQIKIYWYTTGQKRTEQLRQKNVNKKIPNWFCLDYTPDSHAKRSVWVKKGVLAACHKTCALCPQTSRWNSKWFRAATKRGESSETVGAQGVPGSSVRLFLNFTVALCVLNKWLTLELHSLRLAQACHEVNNRTQGVRKSPADQSNHRQVKLKSSLFFVFL